MQNKTEAEYDVQI